MSEQAEAKTPTAIEETDPEASTTQAAEDPGSENSDTEAVTAAAPDPPAAETGEAEAAGSSETAPAGAEEPAEDETRAQVEEEAEAQGAEAQGATAEDPPDAQEAEGEAQDPETPAPAAEAKAEKPREAQAEEVEAEGAQAEGAQAGGAQTEGAEGAQADGAQAGGAQAEGAQAEGEEAEGEKKEEPRELTEEEKERLEKIEGLRQAKKEKRPVTGKVIGWNQGGFHVVVDTITTFCPRSEMEIKNPKSPTVYVDHEYSFYVIKHQKKGKRIVLSRKAHLEEEREKILANMQDELKPGKDLEGTVSSLTDFGAFVDIGGGIEGLVHVTELSNKRVNHPRDMVSVGDRVTVRVLKVEQGGNRISLSMKALEPNPWNEFAEGHPRGSTFQGKVVRKTDFGIFVELQPGLDGMIHTSQLPPGMNMDNEKLEIGKEIEGWVIRTEPGRERISLSLKEVPSEDPWKNIRERFPEGTSVKGQVEDVAPFGVFIQIEPGLTGLLPNSEMNLPRGQDRGKHFPPGKQVQVQVASVDPQRKRISLVPEGARIEGSRADYKDYLSQQKKKTSGGMTAMAAAFAKLKGEGEGDEAEG